jgi:hypothetical protein
MRVLGVRSTRRISTAERRAWSRLGPIVLSVPGVARWSEERKAAVVRLIRAKGAPSEIPFVRQSDACWFLLRHLQP